MTRDIQPDELWQRYQRHFCAVDEIGLRLDISRMNFPDDFFSRMATPMARAFQDMDELENGAVANPDEGRQVGHYWLRAPELAPDPEIGRAIAETRDLVLRFTKDVHDGEVRPESVERFTDLLVIGIGGSALGPQLAADALGDPDRDKLRPHFFDNTDPDGIDRVLRTIGDRLATMICVVISKSGGTPETRNGMLAAKAAYEARGLDFARHAVAVTGIGSKLDRTALEEGFLARFPMWDWVGGRTSETSAVGLLPAALQGLDVAGMLEGARRCDAATRRNDARQNPAALLALMWYYATGGRGERDMVILPYKDRLLLFSRYLQQLIMESLGKELDLEGREVHQGIAVYGNKGSTDQHAYVQQLRDGVNNFFITFIEVLEDGGGDCGALEVEPGVTLGDYLRGFRLGSRAALYESGRESISIVVERLDAPTLGALIALYERAVGFYASLVGINAYHQPGVEAGKKAAAGVLDLQARALAHLAAAGTARSAPDVALAIGAEEETETLFHLLEALAANGRLRREQGEDRWSALFGVG